MVLLVPEPLSPLNSATDFHSAIVGAESTVALYLSDAGHNVAWSSRLGADPFGERVMTVLERYGVNLTHIPRDTKRPTGVFFKDPAKSGTQVVYYRQNSAASAMAADHASSLDLDDYALTHISGITAALSPTCRKFVDTLVNLPRSGLLSFDVNYRHRLWAVEDAAPVLLLIAERSDIVFVGLDEAQSLWGTSTPEEVRQLLPSCEHLVVKNDDVAAVEFHGSQRYSSMPVPVDVIEPIGAGDAFAAGWLDAFLNGGGGDDRLRHGHEFAAAALSSPVDFVPRSRKRV